MRVVVSLFASYSDMFSDMAAPSYLQFFFNLSLVLMFLYLLVQFILTVQRDVEHRISEYAMGTESP